VASPDRKISSSEDDSVWRKSTAIKVGTAMAVVGAIFSLSFAAVGVGIAAGSYMWHKRK